MGSRAVSVGIAAVVCALSGCTNEEDLGGRDGDAGASTAPGGDPARSVGDAGGGPAYDDLVVFVTKSASGGDLGGLAGADAKCTTYAKAAGLRGTYRAWLSDSATDAISRVPEGGPWRVLAGEGKQGDIAFDDRAGWEGYPKVSIDVTEFGKTHSQLSSSTQTGIPYTWTGTALGGAKKGCHCVDWTSSSNGEHCAGDYGGRIGSTSAKDEGWTNFASNPCDARGTLLCFQLPGT